MDSESVQRYARIALQYLAAFLITHGYVSPDATWVQPALGVGVAIATFAWTVWGNRLYARVVSASKVKGVTVDVDAKEAPTSVVKAAADPAVPDVKFRA